MVSRARNDRRRGGILLAAWIGSMSAFVPIATATAAEAQGGARFFCCNDSTGKYVCGDTVPVACYGRAYRELGTDGRTVREVEAPLTAEQRARKAAEEETARREAARQKEQQRKDQALMETYVSVDEIEAMRKRALEDVQQSIRNTETRIEEIKARRKKFEDEAEFYKKRVLPPDVQKGLEDTGLEIKSQESVIEAKKKEIGVIQAKYDDDLKRYQDLQRRKVIKPQ